MPNKLLLPLFIFVFVLFVIPSYAIEVVRQKNVATYIAFPILDKNGAVVSSAAGLDSETDAWSDGSAPNGFADLTNEATELGSTGIYYLSLTAGEMNNDYIYITVKSTTTDSLDQHILIRTIVGDPLNLATSDDGSAVNVTSGAIDTVTSVTNDVGITQTGADKVWSSSTRSLTDKDGFRLSAAGIDEVWDELTSGHTTSGSYGKLLTDNINATIGSRSSHSAADVWSVGARVITGGTIDVNNDKTGYSLTQSFPTNFSALAITAGGAVTVGTNNDKTGYTVSTVQDKTGYSLSQAFPTNFSALAITAGGAVTAGTVNDKTGYSLSASGIDALWDELTSGHTTTGSYGKLLTDNIDAAISSRSTLTAANVWETDLSGYSTADQAGTLLKGAGSAGDPWSTAIPGAYGSGTAGYIVGNNLDSAVSSRLSSAGYTAPDNAGITAILEDTGTTLPTSIDTISGKIDTAQADLDNPSQYKATGFSTHNAGDVVSLILTEPANKLATDASGRVTVGSNADKTGYTVSTVEDKTGYSLTQSFPANFAAFSITAAGAVTVGTNNDKDGYRLSASGVDDIWDEIQSGHTVAGSFGRYLDAPVSSISSVSAETIADAVWEETSDHLTEGTMGKKLNDATAAGNPWEAVSICGALNAGECLSVIKDATDGDKEGSDYSGIEKTIRTHR